MVCITAVLSTPMYSDLRKKLLVCLLLLLFQLILALLDLGEFRQDDCIEVERVFCREEIAGPQQVVLRSVNIFLSQFSECATVKCFRCSDFR